MIVYYQDWDGRTQQSIHEHTEREEVNKHWGSIVNWGLHFVDPGGWDVLIPPWRVNGCTIEEIP